LANHQNGTFKSKMPVLRGPESLPNHSFGEECEPFFLA
jgi:hypothetical protein